MTRAANEYERADRERDYRKHDPRPSDPLPHRLSPPIAGALEVAILVQAVPLMQGAALIEQYARTMAAGAVLEGVDLATSRILKTIDDVFAEDANAQA